jgi:hypothetical protein
VYFLIICFSIIILNLPVGITREFHVEECVQAQKPQGIAVLMVFGVSPLRMTPLSIVCSKSSLAAPTEKNSPLRWWKTMVHV